MKIKILIATNDSGYGEHLSNFLSEKYTDTFEVSFYTNVERLHDLFTANKFDVALLEPNFVSALNLKSVVLPLLLLDDSNAISETCRGLKGIPKYQRISSIVGNILESYAELNKSGTILGKKRGKITAVWSPSGGAGKTTVALAYAAYKVLEGCRTTYLNLESFSSTPVYFKETGRSISKAFEKLESNIHMFLMGIRQQDSGSGVSYFCAPENYDDINILSVSDIENLINACATEIDEVVVDLFCQCDKKTQKVFELADKVLLICDPSSTSQIKLKQFINQHNIFALIQPKTILVNNKGAQTGEVKVKKTISLPLIKSSDPIAIYKTLSGGNFDW